MTNRQIEESYNAMLPLYQSQMTSASGWIGDPLPWTYLGSTSFYIATADTDGTANLTANYPTGLKLTWQDGSGTPKYGYVGSSSAPGGTTNVYLVQSPDYTFSGSAITDRAYSRIASPDGFPNRFNWTPTLTGFSTNPVSAIYEFTINAGVCTVFVSSPNHGTSNASDYSISAPIPAKVRATQYWGGSWHTAYDNSAVLTSPGRTLISSGGTAVLLYKDQAAGTWTASGGKRAYFQLGYEV